MFSVEGPAMGFDWQLQLADVLQRVEQLLDRRLAQFGIRRVRHLARGDNFHAQRSLGRQRDAVLGRLAVDEELRAARI